MQTNYPWRSKVSHSDVWVEGIRKTVSPDAETLKKKHVEEMFTTTFFHGQNETRYMVHSK